ncbi:hypothetical protein DQG23_18530 [Paenibacillus contaminans]|uniref:Secreted protein n=1 Tax=Paenibacillus contaminans TaxID=450362 RepID=A0A329MIX4_9BACL|nr:hypothetical protein DQG23_18530 [Paenibacillus contaminans]
MKAFMFLHLLFCFIRLPCRIAAPLMNEISLFGDPEIPPQFACEKCGGEMYPEYFKGLHGYEYRLEDRLGTRA